MNGQTVLKIFKYHMKKRLKTHLIMLASAFILGFVILYIMSLSGTKLYVYLGSAIAGAGSLLYYFIRTSASWMAEYGQIIKMSIGRKNYFAGTFLYLLASAVLTALIMFALSKAEIFAAEAVFKNNFLDSAFGGQAVQDWMFGNVINYIGLEIIAILAGFFFAAITLKFGMAGFLTVYFTIIFGGILLPIYGDFFAPVLNLIAPAMIFPLIIVFMLLLSVVSTRIVMKTEVS
jgi:hypothetical protein